MNDIEESTDGPPRNPRAAVATRHHRFGWWVLFFFATLGLVLESLNGLRAPWYVDVTNETRRMMLRLAHAHGTLLAIVNIVFALALRSPLSEGLSKPATVSSCLMAATILLPLGFFLGGLVIYDGDPGLGVVLVPLGAVLLLAGVALMARSTRS